jgi:hypothetical protein
MLHGKHQVGIWRKTHGRCIERAVDWQMPANQDTLRVQLSTGTNEINFGRYEGIWSSACFMRFSASIRCSEMLRLRVVRGPSNLKPTFMRMYLKMDKEHPL